MQGPLMASAPEAQDLCNRGANAPLIVNDQYSEKRPGCHAPWPSSFQVSDFRYHDRRRGCPVRLYVQPQSRVHHLMSSHRKVCVQLGRRGVGCLLRGFLPRPTGCAKELVQACVASLSFVRERLGRIKLASRLQTPNFQPPPAWLS